MAENSFPQLNDFDSLTFSQGTRLSEDNRLVTAEPRNDFDFDFDFAAQAEYDGPKLDFTRYHRLRTTYYQRPA